MKIKRMYFIGVPTLVIVGVLMIVKMSSCKRIECISFDGKNDYVIKEIYEEDPYIYRALYLAGMNMLRVEIRYNVTAEEASKAENVQIVRAKGIFEDAAAPYPGEISDVISCSDEYKPKYSSKKTNGVNISLFDGYLNDRLVFGSCIANELKYRDTLSMFYCTKQKRFYQLEIIAPKDAENGSRAGADKILNSLVCNH